MSPPTSQDETSVAAQAMILGEMRGQLRELVHSQNNLATKFDVLSKEVFTLAALAGDMADLKLRLKVLEEKGQQQTGAANLINWVLRNWPGILGFGALIILILRTEGKL